MFTAIGALWRTDSCRISLPLAKLSLLLSPSLGERASLRKPLRRPIQRKRKQSRQMRREILPHQSPSCKRKTETRDKWTGESTACTSKQLGVLLGHQLFSVACYFLRLPTVIPILFSSSGIPKQFPQLSPICSWGGGPAIQSSISSNPTIWYYIQASE